LAKFLRIMLQKASVIKVRIHFTHASEDPDDNMVLEAAYSAEVDYIVSGDKHLLSMKELRDQDRYR
jgi:putative PIN family toxin of toxin-antitoxin system